MRVILWMAMAGGMLMTVGALNAQTSPKSSAATQPAVKSLPADQMLNRMLAPGGTSAQPLEPTIEDKAAPRSAAVAPGGAVGSVLREGTFVVDRLGRFAQTSDGQQMEFHFESDGQSMQDPPMAVLPNLKLMGIEQVLESSRHDMRFRITGMVTEYRGHNYILLEKAVVVPQD